MRRRPHAPRALSGVAGVLTLGLCLAAFQTPTCTPLPEEPVQPWPVEVLNASYVDAELPAASGESAVEPEALGTRGTQNMVLGAAAMVDVLVDDPQGYDDVVALLVGMEEWPGYYRVAVDGSALWPDFPAVHLALLPDRDRGEDIGPCPTFVFVVEDAAGNTSEPLRFTMDRLGAGVGDPQVALTWNIHADLDLHVVDPLGEVIYYGNNQSESGGALDLDAGASCTEDFVRTENISWADGGPLGEYVVRVAYWSACEGEEPVHYTVVAHACDERHIVQGSFLPEEATEGGVEDAVEVLRFPVDCGAPTPVCGDGVCPLEAGAYCAQSDPPSGCEIGGIQVSLVGACEFELSYTGDAGVDRVIIDGCADDYVNLELNACGLEYTADDGAFSVACNWCGRVSYRQEYCQ